jgi:hypothetical protein
MEGIAASSLSIVLRLTLVVNLPYQTRRITDQYRVSGLVQWPNERSLLPVLVQDCLEFHGETVASTLFGGISDHNKMIVHPAGE